MASLLLVAGGRYLTPEFKEKVEKALVEKPRVPSDDELERLRQLRSLGYAD